MLTPNAIRELLANVERDLRKIRSKGPDTFSFPLGAQVFGLRAAAMTRYVPENPLVVQGNHAIRLVAERA